MKRIIIQIYEIQTPSEAESMLELGVDHIGSVLTSEADWKKSNIKDTVALVNSGSGRSSLIPLFSEPNSVFSVLDYYGPHIVHFCEALTSETPENGHLDDLIRLQEDVKKKFSEVKIMRSIPITVTGAGSVIDSMSLARKFEPVTDLFLTDTLLVGGGDPSSGDQPVQGYVGITGKTCNWDIAAALVQSSRIPVILAGGISPDNVSEGIMKVQPFGVDSCTQTNAADHTGNPIRFKKDREKVKQLVEAVRVAETMIQDYTRQG
ncbi:MAG TPA: hypothetical protein HPQ03_16340 [Deltaproteobacteria bacterium]|nr:hypothetical protein [Deltaproteobacteria bacterium]